MVISSNEHFDAVIIGCGMSGLGAGIRLAMFGKRTLILERHNAPGGLNSFYFRDGRKYDVGLHALTNYVPPGVKGTPLGRICRQLRIEREALGLYEQKRSRVAFPGGSLAFSNDFALLMSEVARVFPGEVDNFRRLAEFLEGFEYFDARRATESARAVIAEYIREPRLIEMLLCPLMYYGSAREDDMDFDQFVILFKSIYREGFARPLEGVRRITKVLLDRFREVGGLRKMQCGVRRIRVEQGRAAVLELDDGTEITAGLVFSTIGRVETLRLCDDQPADAGQEHIGGLSFVETITLLDQPPSAYGWEDTIVFFNDGERFNYHSPRDELVDPRSGVICFPNNYAYPAGEGLPEGVLRITALASHARWIKLDAPAYAAAKEHWYATLRRQVLRFLPPVAESTIITHTRCTDMFTPMTIQRYTGHIGGAVYGSPHKQRDGRTALSNLFLCGTDQGMLGIIGAIHSGISIANAYGMTR
ncbi:MAG: FAD-dependent oxidoreductase [Verrucomicrobiota bacterium]|nr:FAD-dependent oxidoreductase [Verrucomicrobiota bacterium]